MPKPLKLKEWLPSEEQEQTALFEWAYQWQPRYPELRWLYASMNGILTNAAFGAKLKRLGRRKGIPDVCLPVARGKWHGLYIEMKTREGQVSIEQKECLAFLQNQGYCALVCRSAKTAEEMIVNYLEEK